MKVKVIIVCKPNHARGISGNVENKSRINFPSFPDRGGSRVLSIRVADVSAPAARPQPIDVRPPQVSESATERSY